MRRVRKLYGHSYEVLNTLRRAIIDTGPLAHVYRESAHSPSVVISDEPLERDDLIAVYSEDVTCQMLRTDLYGIDEEDLLEPEGRAMLAIVRRIEAQGVKHED